MEELKENLKNYKEKGALAVKKIKVAFSASHYLCFSPVFFSFRTFVGSHCREGEPESGAPGRKQQAERANSRP